MYIEQQLKDYFDLSIEEIEEKLTQTRVIKMAINEKEQSIHEVNAAIMQEMILSVALNIKRKSIYEWKEAMFFLEKEISNLLKN